METRRRLTLLLTFVFVDVLGFSLILPLLPYYAETFGATPAILSQSQTANDTDFVKTRQQSASATGFQVGLEEGEGDDGVHGTETIGYVAMDQGIGTWSGMKYEATTVSGIDDTTGGNSRS